MLSFLLKTSRPGLWFPTIWLYILPTAGETIWGNTSFWIGLLYVGFPLNLLVYGWNDIADQDIDQFNPRKDTYLFGAKGNHYELQRLPKFIIGTQFLFWPMLIFLSSWKMMFVLLGIVFFCWIYNARGWGLRSQPPFELICQAGYLLILALSCVLQDVPLPSWQVWLYLCLFCMQSQLIGEVMDIEPDIKGGRKTIATNLGRQHTKLLIIAIVLLEACLVWFWFFDILFTTGLFVFAFWLCIDRFILYKTKEYSMKEFLIFGYGSNILALISMLYVWNTKIFFTH